MALLVEALLAHCLCAAISGHLEQQLHLSCAAPACRTGPSGPWRETARTSGGAAWLPTLARWHSHNLCRTPCARQTGCWPPGLSSWMQPSSLQVSWVSRLWCRVDLVRLLSSVLLMEYTLLLSPELVHGTCCLVPGSLHSGLIKDLVPAGWEQPIIGHRGTRVWSQQLLPGVVTWCHAERHQGFSAVLKVLYPFPGRRCPGRECGAWGAQGQGQQCTSHRCGCSPSGGCSQDPSAAQPGRPACRPSCWHWLGGCCSGCCRCQAQPGCCLSASGKRFCQCSSPGE